MKKYFINMFLILPVLLLLQACSIVTQYSVYEPSIEIQNIGNNRRIFNHTDYAKKNANRESQSPQFTPLGIDVFSYSSKDSIFFEIEEFPREVTLFLGPAYIPIVPNVFNPLLYCGNNKKTDYHILISFPQSKIIDANDFAFYRNKKEIFPKIVEMVEFDDALKKMYTVISSCRDDDFEHIGFTEPYYMFTFSMRKFTTNKIEIKYGEKSIFQIRRKKRLHYKPLIFAH